jgi:hypothetical protein
MIPVPRGTGLQLMPFNNPVSIKIMTTLYLRKSIGRSPTLQSIWRGTRKHMNHILNLKPLRSLALALACFALAPLAQTTPPPGPPVISHDQMRALSTTIGGARVLPTTRTVPHWFGSTFDPNNGVTYGYNMVGADPNNGSGAGCDVTVTVGIIPLNVSLRANLLTGAMS